MNDTKSLPLNAAARAALIMELLSDTYIDENGVEQKKTPLITKEQAIELLSLIDDSIK